MIYWLLLNIELNALEHRRKSLAPKMDASLSGRFVEEASGDMNLDMMKFAQDIILVHSALPASVNCTLNAVPLQP